jgi:hypothetical protein
VVALEASLLSLLSLGSHPDKYRSRGLYYYNTARYLLGATRLTCRMALSLLSLLSLYYCRQFRNNWGLPLCTDSHLHNFRNYRLEASLLSLLSLLSEAIVWL